MCMLTEFKGKVHLQDPEWLSFVIVSNGHPNNLINLTGWKESMRFEELHHQDPPLIQDLSQSRGVFVRLQLKILSILLT